MSSNDYTHWYKLSRNLTSITLYIGAPEGCTLSVGLPTPPEAVAGYVTVTVTVRPGSDIRFKGRGIRGSWVTTLVSDAVGVVTLPNGNLRAIIHLDPAQDMSLLFSGNGKLILQVRDKRGLIPNQYGPIRFERRSVFFEDSDFRHFDLYGTQK